MLDDQIQNIKLAIIEKHTPDFLEARNKKHQVNMWYEKPGGEPEPRTVIPSELGKDPKSGKTYLRAFCLSRKDWRSFRLDRVHSIISTEPRSIEPPEDPTPFSPKGNKSSVDTTVEEKPKYEHQGYFHGVLEMPEDIGDNKSPSKKDGITKEEADEAKGDAGLNLPSYSFARGLGISHSDVMDANSWDKGKRPTKHILHNIGGKRGLFDYDRHLDDYANARRSGASHEQIKEAYSKGVDCRTYVAGKTAGMSHGEILDTHSRGLTPWEIRHREQKRKSVEDYKDTFDVGSSESKVEPTDEEYNHVKSLDVDPQSFDKATYKRLRNIGATHNNCVEALTDGIPLEDYETAYKNNGDHSKAKQEALGYQKNYAQTISDNEKLLNSTGGRHLQGATIYSSNVEHDDDVRDLFGHHLALKNRPKLGGNYIDTPWRRRANEWMLNECSKLDPSLKEHVSNTEVNDDSMILPIESYYDKTNKLTNHYRLKQAQSRTIGEFVKNRRAVNSLVNLGSSQFLPSDYQHDKYEEE